MTKPNSYRISLSSLMDDEGVEDEVALLERYIHESVVPALCSEYCEVEPDGYCEHGCPSVMLAAGII